MPRNRFDRPEGELLAKVLALAPIYARPFVDPMGRNGFRLLNEQGPEFKALKVKIAPQFAPMGPEHRAVAAALGMMPPDVLRGEFVSYGAAVDAAMTLHNGQAFFYGLQTSAITYNDAALAEEVVRAERKTRWLLCWENELFPVIGERRMDELMLEMTEKWNPQTEILAWGMLEHHKTWSVTLSQRILASVRESGAESRSVMWSFGGNGYALNMHTTLLSEAVEALEPWWKTQPNAKRWRSKLRERIKAAQAPE